jgi:hypothetical protein
MDHKEYFIELISGFFEGKYSRFEIARKITNDIDVDEIKGDHKELLVNCEIALRHIDHDGYYTIENELKYYLSCLNDERQFDEEERNNIIKS